MTNTTIFRLRFNRNYITFVKTSRGHVTVSFDPVVIFGRTENSQFSTADEEVVEGLKKHEHFGSLFYVEEEGEVAKAAPKPKQKEEEKPPAPMARASARKPEQNDTQTSGGKSANGAMKDGDAGIPASDDEGHNGGGAGSENAAGDIDAETGNKGETTEADNESALIHDMTVTSKNKAIALIQETYGAKFSQTADIAAMKQEALVVYNLVFDNWK